MDISSFDEFQQAEFLMPAETQENPQLPDESWWSYTALPHNNAAPNILSHNANEMDISSFDEFQQAEFIMPTEALENPRLPDEGLSYAALLDDIAPPNFVASLRHDQMIIDWTDGEQSAEVQPERSMEEIEQDLMSGLGYFQSWLNE
jgi:hypothetical protein